MITLLKPPLQAGANSGLTFRPDSSCVLWLPGQDDPQSATIRDRSGYGSNGAITGATWKRNNFGLWGLDFDGTSDSVNCGNNESLDLLTLTIEAWVTLAQQPASFPEVGRTIASKHLAYWLEIDRGTHVTRLLLYGAPESANYGSIFLDWVLNTWYHVAVTVDGSNVRFYLNGALDVARAQTNIPAVNTNDVRFGVGWSAPERYWWYGRQACQRIYNQALSATKIAGHFNQERRLFGV